MPLFRKSLAEPAPAVHETRTVEEPRRSGLFRRHRSPDTTSTTNTTHHTNGHTSSHRGGLFHRAAEDPSIVAARERVLSAETAEREADKALLTARAAVKEAREHVKRLEREAAEE